MKDWFLSREPRERIVLVLGAIAVAALVLWRFVLMPVITGAAELRSDVDEKSRLLVDLQRAAAIAPADSPARPASTQSLVVLIDRMVQSHNLSSAVTRTRLDGPNGVNVTFQSARFNALLSWLVALESDHGVTVENASVTGAREPGLVNGQILLRRF